MEDLIRQILYYGTISPSSHNTQPWAFKFQDNTIELYVNNKRTLKHSDPKKWETYLSLGACLANLLEAAKAYDMFEKVNIFPSTSNRNLIAQIILKKGLKPVNSELLKTITNRQTNRSNYLPKSIPSGLIKKWQRMAENNSTSSIRVTDLEIIKEIAKLQYEATTAAFADKKFREELSLWVRNNLTRAHDGMPGYVTNIPLLLSFLGSWMIKNINIGKMQGGVEKKWILSSPTILILTIKKNNPESLLKAGQVFEQIAIDVTANNLVYAPLGAIIETPEVSQKFKKLLGTNDTPVMLIRIGYSSKRYKFAPKRKVEEVLIS